MTLSKTVLTSSVYIEGSVSYGRQYEKSKLGSKLLGTARARPIGGLPASILTVDTILTGTHELPSWTHASIGINQSFVGMSLSGNNPERLANYFVSGTEPVEQSAVPASASMYYSKKNTYQTIVVKHTASIFDTAFGAATNVINQGNAKGVPSVFLPLTGALINVVTGSSFIQLATAGRPATIRLDVPVNGKLVDIKVWVELIHLSGSPDREWPMTSLGIALKCPNLTWGNAVPIRNDPALQRLYTSDQSSYIGPGSTVNPYAAPISYFYRDTFILWEGWTPYFGIPFGCPPAHSSEATLNITNGDILSYWARHNPCWNRDRGMRTIFSDGASTPNPRHHVNGNPANNWRGAPCVGTHGKDGDGTGYAWGNDSPWTSDQTVFPATESYQTPGSPPKGWLSGPGGVADVNEWPTTGVNYGTNSIRPLYPLLDPVYQRKVIGSEAPQSYIDGGFISPSQFQKGAPSSSLASPPWTGFRPGLRGVEISGSWELLLIAGAGTALGMAGGGSGSFSQISSSAYFRQCRLEITYEQNSAPSIRRSYTKLSPLRSSPQKLHRISGSDFFFAQFDGTYLSGSAPVSGALDWFCSDTYTDAAGQGEIGRTFGVALNSGSFNKNSSALLYRLSGTLADVAGSAPSWLLNNQFGMPAIPQSSASLVPHVSIPLTDPGLISDIITPQKTLDGPRRLSDVASDVNPALSLWQLADAFSSGTAT